MPTPQLTTECLLSSKSESITNEKAANWRLNYRRYRPKCQQRLYLLRNSSSLTYSAMAAVEVIQFRPIFLALSFPFSAKCRRWVALSPDRAAASLSEISRSSSNGPQPVVQAREIIRDVTGMCINLKEPQ